MAINLVRVKIVAVLLLPYGVGITSQVTNLINTLTVLLFVGLGPGVAKFLASHRESGDEAAAARVVTTSTAALVITSLAGLVAGLALAGDPAAARAATAGDVWILYPLGQTGGQSWQVAAWFGLTVAGVLVQLATSGRTTRRRGRAG